MLDAARPDVPEEAVRYDQVSCDLQHTRQTPSEAVSSYARRLQSICTGAPSLPPEFLRFTFLGGLQFDIQQRLSGTEPLRSLDPLSVGMAFLVHAAIAAEAQLYERQAGLANRCILQALTPSSHKRPCPIHPCRRTWVLWKLVHCRVSFQQLPSKDPQLSLSLLHPLPRQAQTHLSVATEAVATPSSLLAADECASPSPVGLPPIQIVASEAIEPTDMPPTASASHTCTIFEDAGVQHDVSSLVECSGHHPSTTGTLHTATSAIGLLSSWTNDALADTSQASQSRLGSSHASTLTSALAACKDASIEETDSGNIHASQSLDIAAFHALQDDCIPPLMELPTPSPARTNDPFLASLDLEPSMEPAFFCLISSIASTPSADPFAASVQCPPTVQLLPSPTPPEPSTSLELMPFLADECLTSPFSILPRFIFAVPSAIIVMGICLDGTCPTILLGFLDANQIVADELPQPTDKPPPSMPSFGPVHGGR